MADLTIYDSQGDGIRADSGTQSQRIKDLFFDGVRLAGTQTGGSYEIICFFRARESSAARSEQYYAVYRSQTSQREAFEAFPTALRRRIEDEYGLSFDTSTDDTELFRYVIGDRDPSGNPPETNKLDDVVEMLTGGASEFGDGDEFSSGGSYGRHGDPLDSGSTDRYGNSGDALDPFSESSGGAFSQSPKEAADPPTLDQARLGVGNPEAALNVAQYLSTDVSGFVVAENPSSNALDEYDVVIETGSYVGLELLGETGQAYQTYQDRIEQIRRQRQKALSSDDDGNRLKLLAAGGAVVAILAIAVAAAYVLGLFGLPGFLSDGGDTGTGFGDLAMTNVTADWVANGSSTDLAVNGTLTENGEPMADAGLQLVINSSTGNFSEQFTTDANGTFEQRIPSSEIAEDVTITEEFDIELEHLESGFNQRLAYPGPGPEQDSETGEGSDATNSTSDSTGTDSSDSTDGSDSTEGTAGRDEIGVNLDAEWNDAGDQQELSMTGNVTRNGTSSANETVDIVVTDPGSTEYNTTVETTTAGFSATVNESTLSGVGVNPAESLTVTATHRPTGVNATVQVDSYQTAAAQMPALSSADAGPWSGADPRGARGVGGVSAG
ncbi:hypothetical protein GRX03_07400 [Halovenus sp. WSH3]|uniref:Uncharacterized protein n=1 Tax=Halovenus carboxidivorans TaxID=2692199 RepID=A0A6B0T2S4_9EURY|nr:hypothetical protein [Halovenus carboxidivorans]MXR51427.1 hypothetical protein [Halovenus carboxidivorans]